MKTYFTVVGFTFMNIRYASLILPTGIVAYLLQLYPLAVLAGILLIAAFAAEVALSIANGIETDQQIKMIKRAEAEDDQLLQSFLQDVDNYRRNTSGSEDPAEGQRQEGTAPGEGEGTVSPG
jgi:hypothetical protein